MDDCLHNKYKKTRPCIFYICFCVTNDNKTYLLFCRLCAGCKGTFFHENKNTFVLVLLLPCRHDRKREQTTHRPFAVVYMAVYSRFTIIFSCKKIHRRRRRRGKIHVFLKRIITCLRFITIYMCNERCNPLFLKLVGWCDPIL